MVRQTQSTRPLCSNLNVAMKSLLLLAGRGKILQVLVSSIYLSIYLSICIYCNFKFHVFTIFRQKFFCLKIVKYMKLKVAKKLLQFFSLIYIIALHIMYINLSIEHSFYYTIYIFQYIYIYIYI